MLWMPIMSFIWEASSLQLTTPPTPQGDANNLESGMEGERSHYTGEEDWVGEGWEGKDNMFIWRHLRWNLGGREGGMWGGVEKGLSRVTNLRNAHSRGGKRKRNMGKQREVKKGEKLIWTREFWQWWHSCNCGNTEGRAGGVAERDKEMTEVRRDRMMKKNEENTPENDLYKCIVCKWDTN